MCRVPVGREATSERARAAIIQRCQRQAHLGNARIAENRKNPPRPLTGILGRDKTGSYRSARRHARTSGRKLIQGYARDMKAPLLPYSRPCDVPRTSFLVPRTRSILPARRQNENILLNTPFTGSTRGLLSDIITADFPIHKESP